MSCEKNSLIFRTEEEVKRSIDVLEKVEKMKKNLFLNATNTNDLPKDMREFYLSPVTKRLYPWVEHISRKLHTRLREQIKVATLPSNQDSDVICEINPLNGETSLFQSSPKIIPQTS